MNIAVIVSLVVLGIIFILLELFFLPGISLASIGGLICFAAAVVLAYVKIGATAGIITLIAALVATALSVWWFFRSKALDRMSLQSSIDATVEGGQEQQVHPGDQGVCLSRLVPMGKVLINGQTYEARAENEMIDEGAPVEVCAVDKFHITVKQLSTR
ncbi:MAG: NfeD family protein [Bacteroidales bacterium]|nr:NfeD family protein [Bacteroidales bacterium]